MHRLDMKTIFHFINRLNYSLLINPIGWSSKFLHNYIATIHLSLIIFTKTFLFYFLILFELVNVCISSFVFI